MNKAKKCKISRKCENFVKTFLRRVSIPKLITLHVITPRDVNVFIFFKNDRVVMKTMTKNGSLIKTIAYKDDRFFKMVVFITIFFKNLVVSLTIVNDDPPLRIVNDENTFNQRIC